VIGDGAKHNIHSQFVFAMKVILSAQLVQLAAVCTDYIAVLYTYSVQRDGGKLFCHSSILSATSNAKASSYV
jgi:hypothetical protein